MHIWFHDVLPQKLLAERNIIKYYMLVEDPFYVSYR